MLVLGVDLPREVEILTGILLESRIEFKFKLLHLRAKSSSNSIPPLKVLGNKNPAPFVDIGSHRGQVVVTQPIKSEEVGGNAQEVSSRTLKVS